MRKPFLFLLLLVVTATSLNAQTQNNNGEHTKVNEAVTKLFDGIAALDTKMIKQYITTNFLLLEDGVVWNIDSLAGKLNERKAGSFNRTNHLNFIQTAVKENTAWVAYNNRADMTINGQPVSVQWLESAFLEKEGQDWKIRLLHSTKLKPKTP